ncbi:MAG: HDIG domain-containing metalloprotein [Cyanobacteria bacterium J06648_16]
MKKRRSLTKQVAKQGRLSLFLSRFVGTALSPVRQALQRLGRPCSKLIHHWIPWEDVSTSLRSRNTAIRQSTTSTNRSAGLHLLSRHTPFNQTQIVSLLAMLLLTAALGQRFYNQPTLGVETLAPETVFAPASVSLVDVQTTEANRQAARTGSVQVLMLDQTATDQSSQALELLLQQVNSARAKIEAGPSLPLANLSEGTEDYLYRSNNAEWNTIWSLAQRTDVTVPLLQPGAARGGSLPAQINSLSLEQATALKELLQYRQQTSLQSLRAVGAQIQAQRLQYAAALQQLTNTVDVSDPLAIAPSLLKLSTEEWLDLQRLMRLVQQRMLAQGIVQGMPDDLLRQAVQVQLQEAVVPASKLASPETQIATHFLAATLRPNLIEDPERTRQRAEQAVQEVKPVMVSVAAGETIVKRGEAITQENFVLLDHFKLTRRRFNWLGFTGFGLLVGGAAALFLWIDHAQGVNLRQSDHILVLFLILVIAGFAVLKLPNLGMPTLGLLIGSFYGTVLAVAVVSILVVLLLVGANVATTALFAGAIAALVGAWIAPRLRSREEFALLSGFVGISQGVSYLLLTMMFNTVSASAWHTLLTSAALQGLYGVAWSIVALGVSPYLESAFDVITPIRLAELSNPNRPLLKRLAADAPGTFQHTMFVANLAEAAARALNHNVELVRAGTLYHDIGKMHDPLGFIENQMGGPNKHDLINDPWVSADIIKKHVTQGLVMARKHRLPQAIQAFIPEHQGNMLISYFYHQAKERAANDPTITVKESDFRYIGPIPQSPETGIVMLADSCEAALRSLDKNASVEEAYSMVNKIFRARWRDQQLVDSCLTRDDMGIIANIFVQVWQQYNHKRIAYPKGALAPAGS